MKKSKKENEPPYKQIQLIKKRLKLIVKNIKTNDSFDINTDSVKIMFPIGSYVFDVKDKYIGLVKIHDFDLSRPMLICETIDVDGKIENNIALPVENCYAISITIDQYEILKETLKENQMKSIKLLTELQMLTDNRISYLEQFRNEHCKLTEEGADTIFD